MLTQPGPLPRSHIGRSLDCAAPIVDTDDRDAVVPAAVLAIRRLSMPRSPSGHVVSQMSQRALVSRVPLRRPNVNDHPALGRADIQHPLQRLGIKVAIVHTRMLVLSDPDVAERIEEENEVVAVEQPSKGVLIRE